MINIDGRIINPKNIVSAEIDRRFYMNGSVSYLVVKLDNGETIRRESGFGFDVYKAMHEIEIALAKSEGRP